MEIVRTMRARHLTMQRPIIDIDNELRQTRFYHFSRLINMEVNWHIITALVERWRPKTHTFHLPIGECTITLEDVACLTGLRVHGSPVTGSTNPNFGAVQNLCFELLGSLPEPGDLKVSGIRERWLVNLMGSVRNFNNAHQRACYVRTYILCLLGKGIMPSKSDTYVHAKYLPLLRDIDQIGQYSWGSACLAMLYRGLDRATRYDTVDICGCMVLLQAWAWYRMPWLAPRPIHPVDFPLALRWLQVYYPSGYLFRNVVNIRQEIDQMEANEFVWQPYLEEELDGLIPLDFRHESPEWRMVCPLICFETIEWHAVDRVMRQFGFTQPIPGAPRMLGRSHNVDLKGRKKTYDWRQECLRHYFL